MEEEKLEKTVEKMIRRGKNIIVGLTFGFVAEKLGTALAPNEYNHLTSIVLPVSLAGISDTLHYGDLRKTGDGALYTTGGALLGMILARYY